MEKASSSSSPPSGTGGSPRFFLAALMMAAVTLGASASGGYASSIHCSGSMPMTTSGTISVNLDRSSSLTARS
jgi:hypothetical protein